MSSLVQRLVGQALGSSATLDASRVRPAASVHAQVPLGITHEIDQAPKIAPEIPRVVDIAPSDDNQQPVTAARDTTHQTASMRETVVPTAQAPPRTATMRVVIDQRGPSPDFQEWRAGDPAERAPTPLLREESSAVLPTATVLPLPKVRAPREPVTNQASSVATEVHVHIGRIDVIAATEAKKPEKKPRAPRNTRPLAEYLAGRRSL